MKTKKLKQVAGKFLVPVITLAVLGEFLGSLYLASPRHKFKLEPKDKLVMMASEPVGFPVIKKTIGVQRQGKIEACFDEYLAWGGKTGNAMYRNFRENTDGQCPSEQPQYTSGFLDLH